MPNPFQSTRPDLLGSDANPTLRYPIASLTGGTSYGWFDVTRKGIHYTVVDPPKKKSEGFEAAIGDLSGIRMDKGYLEFKISNNKYTIFYASQEYWGSARRGTMDKMISSMNASGTVSIQRALTNFDSVYAEVKPTPPPVPEISLRAEPGTIEKGHPATLIWTSTNATTLDLEPGSGNVASAGSTSVVPQDSTTYTLTATGPGGTRVATARVSVAQPTPASPPIIILVEPSVAGPGETLDISTSPLTIRGVAMDNSGIPAVTINGMSAAMRPKSAVAAEFSSDLITLQPGENKFEVSATNAAHAEAKVTFIARYTPPTPPREKPQQSVQTNPKGLAKSDIIDLLKGDVPSARLADLVKERGIKFVPTDHDLNEIRAAGGGDDLVEEIKQAAATPPK
jgi:hypothetical protein